ncbi:unnamed protein product [Calypogeia fissa]
MARWLEGMRTRKTGMLLSRAVLLEHVSSTIFFFAICMTTLTSSYAQPGFLSIDCGSSVAVYNDSLGLAWFTDNGTYIKTGATFQQSYVNWSFLNSSAWSGVQALQSFRYFPELRNKYCYELDTEPNYSYLIRAGFYMNAEELTKRAPFQFSTHLNGSLWFTLNSSSGNQQDGEDLFDAREAIFYASGPALYFCIQPMLGVPFISSLELRQLTPTMYKFSGSQVQYLSLLFRYNLGPSTTSTPNIQEAVRFPDDSYDRIWEPFPWMKDPCNQNNGITSCGSNPTPQAANATADINYVPPKVMQGAWLFQSHALTGFPVGIYNNYTPQVQLPPLELTYMISYLQDLNSSNLETYGIEISVGTGPDTLVTGLVNVSNQASMLVYPNNLMESAFYSYWVQLVPGTSHQGFLPLNAVEAYARYDFDSSSTLSDEGMLP